MRNLLLLILIFFTGFTTSGQNFIHKQLPKPKAYDSTKVVDAQKGVSIYEPLNFRLGGDSTRNCKGYACSGWVEDFYTSGEILHRGFYVDGHLKNYENLFPNGAIEREFVTYDNDFSEMKLYNPDGSKKAVIMFFRRDTAKVQLYYPNGQVSKIMEMHDDHKYYMINNTYFENGNPQSTFELAHKKKLIFDKNEYYENGNRKLEGHMQYASEMNDYQKSGKWSMYDESGKLIRTEVYSDGKLASGTDF